VAGNNELTRLRAFFFFSASRKKALLRSAGACRTIYVNKEQSFGSALDSLIDFRIRGDCDTSASLIQGNDKA